MVLPEFFSSDGSLPLQFLVIFGVIVVVMMGAYLVFRRLFGRGTGLSQRSGNRARQPRLGIVDIYELDRQRQLILLRRDNVEHLLLVGGPNDVVVERNVQRGAGSRLPVETVMRPEPASDMTALPGQDPEFDAPAFEMPLVVPTPLPGAPEPALPRLDPAMFEPDLEPQEAVPTAPAPTRSRANPFLRRTPPPLVEPRREPPSERVPEPAAADHSEPDHEPAQEPAALAAGPPVLPGPEPRPVDPATLSSMALQLETALKRSSSAVTPPPGGRAPPGTGPEQPGPQPAVPASGSMPVSDPVAARMAAASGVPRPANDAPREAARTGMSRQPEPMRQQGADLQAASRDEARPDGPPSPAALPPVPATEPGSGSGPVKGTNPFSVEEIEAEFARLLGRPLDKKG